MTARPRRLLALCRRTWAQIAADRSRHRARMARIRALSDIRDPQQRRAAARALAARWWAR